jgi:hypothetical protein
MKVDDRTDTQKRLDEALERMNADKKRREALESLPPAVILRARDLDKKKKFHRKVVKRTPKDFHHDTLELECGHTLPVFSTSDSELRQCGDCIERWLLRRAPRPKTLTRSPDAAAAKLQPASRGKKRK